MEMTDEEILNAAQDRQRLAHQARQEFAAAFQQEQESTGTLFGFDGMPKPFQIATEAVAWAFFRRGKGLK